MNNIIKNGILFYFFIHIYTQIKMNCLTLFNENIQFPAPSISIPSSKPYTILPMNFEVSSSISIQTIDIIINDVLKPYSEEILFIHYPEYGYWELLVTQNTTFRINIYNNNKNYIIEFQKYYAVDCEINTFIIINTIFQNVQQKLQ